MTASGLDIAGVLEFLQLQLSFHTSPYQSNMKHQRRGEEIFSSAGNLCTWVIPTLFSRDLPWHGAEELLSSPSPPTQ